MGSIVRMALTGIVAEVASNGAPEYLSVSESLVVSLACILVVFMVLAVIMCLIMALSAVTKTTKPAPAVTSPTPSVAPAAPVVQKNDDEVVAAITAAMSTMVRSKNVDIKITKVG